MTRLVSSSAPISLWSTTSRSRSPRPLTATCSASSRQRPSSASWCRIYSCSSVCSSHRPVTTSLVTHSKLFILCVFDRREVTHQVQRAPDQMIPHTGTVLTASATHQHHAMLLDVVALSRDVRRDGPARAQPDTSRLALARVGLLGARDADFEADALALRGEDFREGRGDGVARSLGFTAALDREMVSKEGNETRRERKDVRGGLG
jgi:hypothetical protein